MKRLMSGLIVGISLLLLSACQSAKSEYVKISEQFFTMDTYITYTIYALDSEVEAMQALMVEANALFETIDNLANRFEVTPGLNNVATVNQAAGQAPVAVDEKLIEMVQFAKQAEDQSGGAFSVVLGPVSDVWRMYQEGEKTGVPTQDELEALRPLLNSDQLIVDEVAQTLYLEQAGMILDLGAIAKGYATEYVADWLVEQGVEHAIVNAGGNVKTIGTHPVNETFRIGLQDPDNLSAVFGSVEIGATSVVTSGDYQRYFEYEGQRYHHLLDPETLQPARLYRSVSVVAENSTVADVLSTTLFMLPQNEGEAFIEQYYPDVAVLWYDLAGNISMNQQMEGLFTLGGE